MQPPSHNIHIHWKEKDVLKEREVSRKYKVEAFQVRGPEGGKERGQNVREM